MEISNLKRRVTTAAALLGVVLFLEILSHWSCTARALFLVVATLFPVVAAFEIAQIGTRERSGIPRLAAYLIPAAIPSSIILLDGLGVLLCSEQLSSVLELFPLVAAASLVALLLALLWMMHEGRVSLERAAEASRDLFPLVILVGGGGACLVSLARLYSHTPLFWVIAVAAINDIAAYFAGSKLQGPKLSPLVSPNKTISGSVGGIAAGVVVGVLFRMFSGIEGITGGEALVVSLLMVVGAQVADLSKSYFKRIYGVKDSGTILPGHGGVLDRIDGILGAALVYHVAVVFLR